LEGARRENNGELSYPESAGDGRKLRPDVFTPLKNINMIEKDGVWRLLTGVLGGDLPGKGSRGARPQERGQLDIRADLS